jgi:hypothetical protein
MRARTRATAAAVTAAVTLAALLLTDTASASTSVAKAVKVAPCTMSEVSFYFGGATQGIGQVSFDLTLLAHDGVTCTLSDTPQIKLGGPPSQKKPIPLSVNGRGGTLTLRAGSPLHATFFYAVPDTSTTVEVSTLTLSMPDHTSRATGFLTYGVTDVSAGGVSVTSWTTGAGLGEGESSD